MASTTPEPPGSMAGPDSEERLELGSFARAKSFAAGEIEKMARSQMQPALILWRIVDSLVKKKIEIPGYYPLAELVLAAVNTRKVRKPWQGPNANFVRSFVNQV